MKNNLIEQDIHDFFKMAPDAREKRINALPVDKQLTLVLFAPWERRHEIITASERARELVQAMPAEELFWTVKAAGPEDSTIILNLATPGQLQIFFDLDWWHKAEIRPEKIAAWLLLLFQSSRQAIGSWLKWILQKDVWLIASVLSTFITVVKRPDDMDIQEAKDLLPGFTLDNVYYISFKKQKLAPLFATVIGQVLEISPGHYRDVLETMLWETRSHNIETAYRLRCGRLQDLGIPDYYESIDIYLPMKPEEMHETETAEHLHLPSDLEMPAFVPTLYISGFPVLEQGFRRLSGSGVMERLIRETTGVANKVLMADLVDLDDPAAMKKALEKTFHILNLGLEFLEIKWSKRPEEILASHFLEEIMRVSCNLLMPLSTKASELSKKDSSRFLPYETRELISAASHRPAMMYDSTSDTKVNIRSLSQLKNALEQMEMAALWCVVIEHMVPHYSIWSTDIDWKRTNFLAIEEFTAEAALCTSICNLMVKGKFQVRPVQPGDLPILKKILLKKDIKRAVSQIMDIIGPIAEDINDQRKKDRLYQLIAQSIEECFSEIQQIPPNEAYDMRFIKTVVVELEPQGAGQPLEENG